MATEEQLLTALVSDDKPSEPVVHRPKKKPRKSDTYKETTKKEPIPPMRAIALKGRELRSEVRSGRELDPVFFYDRFVEIWQEWHHLIWRAKRRELGKVVDGVQYYKSDDRLVATGLEGMRNVVESMLELREKIQKEGKGGVPRWIMELITQGLKEFPEAREALLEEINKGEIG